ncbi:Caffeine-induced death protein 2 [Elaphomyces granulatus]
MSEPSSTSSPALSSQFCFNEKALKDFLRLSRAATDDSIEQNLNAFVTPARSGFNPSSTSVRLASTDKCRPDPNACRSFMDHILFPSWRARSDVLNYCARVATDPDPGDPDLNLREAELAKYRQRSVDERLDPYSSHFFPRKTRTELLANIVGNERSIEQIVRARTWDLIVERCNISGNWEEALNRWHQTQDRTS